MQPELSYRTYQSDDFVFCNGLIETNMAAYFQLYQIDWSPAFYQQKLAQDLVSICLMGERKVGFFHMSEKNHQAYLNAIQLHEAYQGKGLGTLIFAKLEAMSRSQGYQQLWLN